MNDIQSAASDILNGIFESGLRGNRKDRNFLKRLWNESWPSIKEKMLTEGSAWYVWYMDGVNAYLQILNKGR